MEYTIGLKGKDFVILGADSSIFNSIISMKGNYKRIKELTPTTSVTYSGQLCDVPPFSSYISANINLIEMMEKHALTPAAIANYIRSEVARDLRSSSAKFINMFVGGYDNFDKNTHLYRIDKLGVIQEVKYGVHGYGSYFALAILDSRYRDDISLEDAISLIRDTMTELKVRFLANYTSLKLSIRTATEIREVEITFGSTESTVQSEEPRTIFTSVH